MGQVKHGEDPQVKEIGVANAQRFITSVQCAKLLSDYHTGHQPGTR